MSRADATSVCNKLYYWKTDIVCEVGKVIHQWSGGIVSLYTISTHVGIGRRIGFKIR